MIDAKWIFKIKTVHEMKQGITAPAEISIAFWCDHSQY